MGRTNPNEQTCIFCSKNYKDQTGLNYHYLVHTGERPFYCNLCDAAFRGKNDLKRHISTHHNKTLQCKTFVQKPQLMECNICEKLINGNSSLARHIRSHTGETPYKCDKCQKQFKRKGTLKVHEQTHLSLPVKSFCCELCGACFVRKDVLKAHMVVHAKIKPHQCELCGKSYSQLSGLGIHQKLVHQLDKDHECKLCEKRFGTKGGLVSHMRIHTKETPFKCAKCPKSFAHLATLINHKKTHFGDKL